MVFMLEQQAKSLEYIGSNRIEKFVGLLAYRNIQKRANNRSLLDIQRHNVAVLFVGRLAFIG